MQKEWISMYQRPPALMPEPGDPEYQFLLDIGAQSQAFIFPEYFTMVNQSRDLKEMQSNSENTMNRLIQLSQTSEFQNTLITGGSIIAEKEGRFYNAAPIIYNGIALDSYFKRNLFQNEKILLSSGNSDLRLNHPFTNEKWGFLICADVLQPDLIENYREVNYIAIPVASPFKPQDTAEDQDRRDQTIFVEGAKKSGAILLKCCLAANHTSEKEGEAFKPIRVQGRSLIADSTGIIIKAPHIKWRGILAYSPETKQTELTEYFA